MSLLMSKLTWLLRKAFVLTSQPQLRSLETRGHSLELALDEISFDLAVSNKKAYHTDSAGASCCMLTDADFLNYKFWRKTEGRRSASRLSSSQTTQSSIRWNAALDPWDTTSSYKDGSWSICSNKTHQSHYPSSQAKPFLQPLHSHTRLSYPWTYLFSIPIKSTPLHHSFHWS